MHTIHQPLMMIPQLRLHGLDLLLCAPARKSNIIPEILDLAFEDHESVIECFDLGGEG